MILAKIAWNRAPRTDKYRQILLSKRYNEEHVSVWGTKNSRIKQFGFGPWQAQSPSLVQHIRHIDVIVDTSWRSVTVDHSGVFTMEHGETPPQIPTWRRVLGGVIGGLWATVTRGFCQFWNGCQSTAGKSLVSRCVRAMEHESKGCEWIEGQRWWSCFCIIIKNCLLLM